MFFSSCLIGFNNRNMETYSIVLHTLHLNVNMVLNATENFKFFLEINKFLCKSTAVVDNQLCLITLKTRA